DKSIPEWVDYSVIYGLKREARLKLESIRPATFGQAGRIQGVTPADLAVVSVWVKKGSGAGAIVSDAAISLTAEE
ncbi:MAG: tRNA uridine-5-carboxymethylaminomethyl(34) synthesis enzyme MnmG, partial [Verrucomicrobiota bacterium]